MLSYQHIYHAGCPADVHKHAVLSSLISKMVEKDKPLSYMETHAGRGVYDLQSAEAVKTGEAKDGIFRFFKRADVSHPYFKLIADMASQYGDGIYPGSPMVANCLLRDNDQMHLMELHPQEHYALKGNFLRDKNVHVHKRDGYEGVMAISPPNPRRGVVLIDPSFEVKSEYDQAAEFIIKLHKKWAEAVIMLWYPILEAGNHESMVDRLQNADLPKYIKSEVRVTSKGMRGSGVIMINAPYGVDEEIKYIEKWFA